MLNSLLWSGTDVIIQPRDPMQNPGQTQKHDPVDLENPDDLTRFQPCSILLQTLAAYIYVVLVGNNPSL